MTVLQNFTFFNEATATGESPILKNIHGEALTVCVSGTFVGTIVLNGKQGGEDFTLTVVNLADLESATSITAAGSYEVVCPHGFEEITAEISEYTSGSITVTGRLCAE